MKHLIVILCIFFNSFAFANQYFEPVAVDSRIKTFIYNPNEIYNLKFRIGYNSIIEFSNDEAIETISLGDPYPWKLTPLGTRLFIKPIETGSQTNMTVITNKRVYLFEIASEVSSNVDRSQIVHVARFFYPAGDASNRGQANQDAIKSSITGLKQIIQEKRTHGNDDIINTDYSFSGKKNITTPIEMFDDQSRTYIKFEDNLNIKSLKLFVFDNQNKKRSITFKRTGDFIIITGVYRNLLLESGKMATLVFNEKTY